MKKRLIIVLSWFPITLTLLIINLAVLAHMSAAKSPKQVQSPVSSVIAQAEAPRAVTALDGTAQILNATVVPGDARGLLLKEFLEEHESPMSPYAEMIVREADKNNLDFRLVVAIAMCESNLGKRMPSKDSYNAWGISVYSGQNHGATFKDWESAITWVSKYLKERYFDRGLTDLYAIGEVYAPPSVNTGYSWTNCVETFQKSIL